MHHRSAAGSEGGIVESRPGGMGDERNSRMTEGESVTLFSDWRETRMEVETAWVLAG